MSHNTNLTLLSWNVRGLNERDKRLAVRQALLVEKPDIITFQETKLEEISNTKLREICGRRLDTFEILPSQGTRGGILVAWNQRAYTKVSAELKTHSITVHLKHIQEGTTFAFTAVYGPTTHQERNTFFEEIRESKPQGGTPWILGGDFNVTAEPEERTSNDNTWRSTLLFSNLISELELINLSLQGQKFTWSNEREQPHMARLDRFIISAEWNSVFPNSMQKALANTNSDHSPIVLRAKTNFRRSNFFRFENIWLRFEDFKEMVKNQWMLTPTATTPKELQDKMNSLRQKITAWAKEKIGNIKAQILVCRNFLTWIDKVRELRQLTRLEKLIKAIIKRRHVRLAVLEEDIWRQRARTRWETQGDRGTRYFHAVASNSKRINCISQIEENSVQFSDQATKARVFFDFFRNLMGTQTQTTPEIYWQNLYPTQLNLEGLVNPLSLQEIEKAIDQWPNNKSPGPDGFPGEFYKTFTNLLSTDLLSVFTYAMNNGENLDPLNSSFIILIPKNDNPRTPSEFRPISLLHGIQKIYSKILSNRLQPHMNHIIMDAQTGFQKNKQITESYVYAQQVLHFARKGKTPIGLLKVDIRKAFDTVSWDFTIQVMKSIGFPDQWLKWIKHTVFRGTSQILINGLLGKKLILKRGVRQGDPLSPSLFIIAIDFLARYLQKLTSMGAIRLPIPAMRPCLLYADDALLFFKPDKHQAQAIKIALLVFQKVSGLQVNLQKSEVLMANTPSDQAVDLVAIFGCRQASFPFTYLGLPLSDKKLPRTAYLPLLHRVNKRLGGWAARFLSLAGRLVLVNSTLSSLPIYLMTVLKLPQWVIEHIDKVRRRFLWHGAGEQQKGYNLVNWTEICEPKEIGGLGILDLRTLNQMLLLKWYWWWYKEEHRLWKPLMNQTAATQDGRPIAPVFNMVTSQSQAFFNTFTRWTPGEGSKISFWNQDWGEGIMSVLFPNLFTFAINTETTLQQAAEALQENLSPLFRPTLSLLAQQELAQLYIIIECIDLQQGQVDTITWKGNSTGHYTVQSAYRLIKGGARIKQRISKVWNLNGPPRMRIFIWLAIRNSILTHDNLQKRGWEMVSRCTLCKKSIETGQHLFQECTYTLQLYNKLRNMRRSLKWPSTPTIDITDKGKTGTLTKEQKTALLVMNFIIWKERCARCFTEVAKDTDELLQDIIWQLEFYKKKEHPRIDTNLDTGALQEIALRGEIT